MLLTLLNLSLGVILVASLELLLVVLALVRIIRLALRVPGRHFDK